MDKAINTSVTCLCCGANSRHWFTKTSARPRQASHAVMKCDACRSAFAWPRPTDETLRALYDTTPLPGDADRIWRDMQDSERRHANGSRDAARIARRLSSLIGGRLLDIGAGNGLYSKHLVTAGFEVDALEPDHTSREVFKRVTGFNAIAGFFDTSFAQDNSSRYDAVLLSQVLEHIDRPRQFIARISTVLKPKGIVAIAIPHFGSWLSRLMGKRDIFITPPYHLNYFSARGLSTLMQREGYHEAHTETVTWFDPQRVARRLGKLSFSAPIVNTSLRLVFCAADFAGGGNTLEAYYRHNSPNA